MRTPTVDLTRVPLAELVLRAGDARDPAARRAMQGAYLRVDNNYPDAVGLSCLFRPGASLDDLAREGSFPHGKLSYSIITKIVRELAAVGYAPVLYVTPAPQLNLPDHHSLAVAHVSAASGTGMGVVEPTLPDDAADALIRALDVIDNPYRMGP